MSDLASATSHAEDRPVAVVETVVRLAGEDLRSELEGEADLSRTLRRLAPVLVERLAHRPDREIVDAAGSLERERQLAPTSLLFHRFVEPALWRMLLAGDPGAARLALACFGDVRTFPVGFEVTSTWPLARARGHLLPLVDGDAAPDGLCTADVAALLTEQVLSDGRGAWLLRARQGTDVLGHLHEWARTDLGDRLRSAVWRYLAFLEHEPAQDADVWPVRRTWSADAVPVFRACLDTPADGPTSQRSYLAAAALEQRLRELGSRVVRP